MDLGLADRAYIVTGASAGIGLAITRRLLEEGASVAGCARDLDRLTTALNDELARHPNRLHLTMADVTVPSTLHDFVAGAAGAFGRLDGVVCNAGAAHEATVRDASPEDWLAEVSLKTRSSLDPITEALPWLRDSDRPRAVVVGSMVAIQPLATLALSSAARAVALEAVRELAANVHDIGMAVNTMLLGPVVSDQWRRRHACDPRDISWEDWMAERVALRGIPAGRFGRPEEAADLAAFLLSAHCPCSGAAIELGGGMGRGVRAPAL